MCADGHRPKAVALKAVSLASKTGDISWLLEVAIPYLNTFTWDDGQALTEWRELEREVCGWSSRPRLNEARSDVSRILGFAYSANVDQGPAFLLEWNKAAASGDARAITSFLGQYSSSLESLAAEHRGVAKACGLPTTSANFTPRGFLGMVKRRAVAPSSFELYAQSCSLLLFFYSKQGSIKPFISALNCWAEFCDSLDLSHFPVSPLRVMQFAAVCREVGTFRAYASHLKSACALIQSPVEWADDPCVRRAKTGLSKCALVFKGPSLFVSSDLIVRMASVTCGWSHARFFCILSWVFMLRAASECSELRLVAVNDRHLVDLHEPLPEGVEGLIGRVKDTLTIRLKKRKSHLCGDVVSRSCTCVKGSDVSMYVPSILCPVHVLLPWLQRNVEPGEKVFSANISKEAAQWLRIALEARDVPRAREYGLHSLRRGAANALVVAGGDLATLLRAGGWRSSAFRAYLDLVGLEKKVLAASIQALVDLDIAETE